MHGTIPGNFPPTLSFTEAEQILREHGRGALWTAHCAAVSGVAARFGEALAPYYGMDLQFLRTAALLHDLGRCRTHDPVLHGAEGYRLLMKIGHPEHAYVCASHVLFGFDRETARQIGLPARDFFPLTLEQRLVPVADSLVEFDRPTTIGKRLESIRKRYSANPSFLAKIEDSVRRIREFVDRIDRECGISLEKIAEETL